MGEVVGVEFFLDVQEQNLIELGDRFGAPVVLLHQGLTGSSGVFGLFALNQFGVQAQLLRYEGLKVKDQAVLPPLGHQVKTCSDQVQDHLIFLDHLGF